MPFVDTELHSSVPCVKWPVQKPRQLRHPGPAADSMVGTGSLNRAPGFCSNPNSSQLNESLQGGVGGNVMWKIICRADTKHQFFLLLCSKCTGSQGVFSVLFCFGFVNVAFGEHKASSG